MMCPQPLRQDSQMDIWLYLLWVFEIYIVHSHTVGADLCLSRGSEGNCVEKKLLWHKMG